MVLGPFDGRKKRSRCQACSASHLKCSGQAPCTNCERRQMRCAFGAEQGKAAILVERGKQITLWNWQRKQKTVIPLELSDDRLRHMHFFDLFARANDFSGRTKTLGDEVKKHAAVHSAQHLMDAMLAIGALQAVKVRSAGASPRLGLEYYSKSVIGLRAAIDGGRGAELNTVLWTTLFLGLFDLMSEDNGDGWGRHMIHGTARALEATGPTPCRSGPGRGFFIQARIFEVSRTILFNQTSFLTQPEWMSLSRELWTRDRDEWRPLDSLLDIMVMCSRLCSTVRLGDTIFTPDLHGQPTAEARSICADGHDLRAALDTWHASYAGSQGHDMLLSRIFSAAISIYLSGIFDYGMTLWTRLGLAPARLNSEEAQTHAETILKLTALALDTTELSPLLFLFPLRIAGSRSRTAGQREWVMRLVARVGGRFAAAAAIQAELDELWGLFGVGTIATDEQTLAY